MNIVLKILCIFLYKAFFSKLPVSNSLLGRLVFAKQLRYFATKGIIKSIGKNCNIEKNAQFASDISLGNFSGIGVNCLISNEVYIGDNVLMGPNVMIFTRNHKFERKDIPIRLQGYSETKPVRVMDDVWIGANVIILPGVTINEGAIIAAGAVVTMTVPRYCIYGGVPAKKIKDR